MHILLFFLLFLVAVVIAGISIVGFILKTIFGIGRGSSSKSRQTYSDDRGQRQSRSDYNQHNNYEPEDDEFNSQPAGKKHKKIFSKDEGEYVDFEEIK